MRTLLFTGKGGVGKTTVAAATALRCADAGLRTIVVSTDPAHSLADALDRPLGSDPTAVVDGLWAQQVDASEHLEDAWGAVQAYLVELLGWGGLDDIEAEELSILPGLDELFALAEIKEHADAGAWDVVVIDCGPTAETIRLLSLPEVLSWYMDRVFPLERTVAKIVRPVLSRMTSMPVAGDHVFGAARRFYERLDGVRALLTDGARTSVRIVVNPEAVVIAEARRTATYLGLFGYGVDAVVVNRLLPDEISDPWFKAWKELHAEHLASIERGFAPLPVLRAGLAAAELVGPGCLRRFGAEVYGELQPEARLHQGVPLRVEKRGGSHVLWLSLPFAERDELEVGRRDHELLVRVGPHRRSIVLPDFLRRRDVTGASLRDDGLEVSFAPAAAGAGAQDATP
ncbi:MAG: ArsA family ATPase [Actinobacteria bacterium]|nr:MAG: ArsA family ATPase [Actinomycetota bacterium]